MPNFIDSLESGDAVEFKQQFEAAVETNLSDLIELEKIEVAKSFFGQQTEAVIEKAADKLAKD